MPHDNPPGADAVGLVVRLLEWADAFPEEVPVSLHAILVTARDVMQLSIRIKHTSDNTIAYRRPGKVIDKPIDGWKTWLVQKRGVSADSVDAEIAIMLADGRLIISPHQD